MLEGSVRDGNGDEPTTERTLEDVEERVADLQRKLANKHRFPRGTYDSVELAAAAVMADTDKEAERHVRDRLHAAVLLRPHVERILKDGSHTVKDLTSLLKQTNNAVVDVISTLRAEDRVYNMGTAEHPLWTLKLGPEASADELRSTIIRLIAERPMTTGELSAATGSSERRVAISLTGIRKVLQVFSTGSARRLRWFRLPEDARVVVRSKAAKRR